MTVMCAWSNVLPCYLNVCLCVGVHAVADCCGPGSPHARVCEFALTYSMCACLAMGSGPTRKHRRGRLQGFSLVQ